MGDSGVEQHAIGAELHRNGDVAGRAHARIDDHRIVRVAAVIAVLEHLEDHRDRGVIGDASAAADGAACGHHACSARVADAHGHDRIIARVAHDGEAVGDELPTRLESPHGIRQQRLLVAEDFELHPILAWVVELLENLSPQPGHPHRIRGAETPGRVGQDRVPIGVDEIQQRPATLVQQPLPADRDRHHFGSRSVQRFGHDLVGLVLSRADDQPAGDRDRAELKRLHQIDFELLSHWGCSRRH